jgi:ubiquinone/menaquinone biosynthesis C-methylase UbiE
MVVLDLGCGYGRFIEFYAPLVSFVYGIDVTDYIIEICKTKYAEIKNVEFIKNNGYSLEMIDDNSIDLVSCYTVFQHIPRKATQSYLKEFSRILKSDGRIIIQFSGAQSNNDKRYNDVGLDTKDYKIQYTKDDIQILAMRSKLKIKKIDVDVKGDSGIWYWIAMEIYN